ncbi:hypothetical protein M406DRAFT_263299, partial [Cryphonectria parasitica EP155]
QQAQSATIANQQAQLAQQAQQAQSTSTATNSAGKAYKMNKLAIYNSNQKTLHEFLTYCRAYFLYHTIQFIMESEKIILAETRFKKNALI